MRKYLSKHEAVTAAYAGLAGYKNGALLKAAEESGFDVLLTGDKTLQYEQNMENRKIALVCLSANSWEIIRNNVAKIVAAIETAAPGSFIPVECGQFSRRYPKEPEAG